MTCKEALALISASLDGELTLAEQAQLQEHLDSCPHCRVLSAELAGIHGACGDAWDVQPPAELKARILSALPAQQRAPSKAVYWKRWGAMAAAIALVALAAWQLPRSFFERSPEPEAALPDAAEAPMLAMMSDEVGVDASENAFDVPEDAFDADLPDYVNGPAVRINSIPIGQKSADGNAVSGGAAMSDTVVAAQEPAAVSKGDATDVGSAAESGAAVDSAASDSFSVPSPVAYKRAWIGDENSEVPETAPASGADNSLAEPLEPLAETESEIFLYCGVLTLAEYEPDEDYPAETFPGGCRYILPNADFLALVDTLNRSGKPYDLRMGDESAVGRPGLVIVTGSEE